MDWVYPHRLYFVSLGKLDIYADESRYRTQVWNVCNSVVVVSYYLSPVKEQSLRF